MAQALGDIGSFFTSPIGKAIGSIGQIAGTGLGLVSNLQTEKARQAAMNQARANMNLSPSALSAQVRAAEQPLNAGLVQAITGNVNANLAEQGLSQAPGIIASDIAQALAIPQQQNQQAALQLIMQKLGLPQEYLKTLPPGTDLSPAIAAIIKSLQGFPTNAGTPGATATTPNTTSSYGALLPSLAQLAPQESWTPPTVDLSQFGGMSSAGSPGAGGASDLFAGLG